MDELIWALKNDPSGHVRGMAAKGLGSIGSEDALDPLVLALDDEDTGIRQIAAIALGDIGSERALESLIAALDDNDHLLRIAAVKALGKIGDERAVEPLILALGNNEHRVKGEVVEALGEIGDERAVQPLIDTLVWNRSYNQNEQNRFSRTKYYLANYASSALGKIGGEVVFNWAVNSLEQGIHKGDASRILGNLGDSRAVKPLIRALEESAEGNVYAAEALGKIGNGEAVEPLILALGHTSLSLKRAAAESLGKIRALPAIIPLGKVCLEADSLFSYLEEWGEEESLNPSRSEKWYDYDGLQDEASEWAQVRDECVWALTYIFRGYVHLEHRAQDVEHFLLRLELDLEEPEDEIFPYEGEETNESDTSFELEEI